MQRVVPSVEKRACLTLLKRSNDRSDLTEYALWPVWVFSRVIDHCHEVNHTVLRKWSLPYLDNQIANNASFSLLDCYLRTNMSSAERPHSITVLEQSNFSSAGEGRQIAGLSPSSSIRMGMFVVVRLDAWLQSSKHPIGIICLLARLNDVSVSGDYFYSDAMRKVNVWDWRHVSHKGQMVELLALAKETLHCSRLPSELHWIPASERYQEHRNVLLNASLGACVDEADLHIAPWQKILVTSDLSIASTRVVCKPWPSVERQVWFIDPSTRKWNLN
jgi:hypothetical protein